MSRTLAILACFVPFVAACHIEVLEGSGAIRTEPRVVPPFTAISVGNGLRADITVGAGYTVAATADDNILPYLRTRVIGDTLVVDFEIGVWIHATSRPQVLVAVPTLRGITGSGGALLTANHLDATALAVSLSGGSQLDVEGKAGPLTVDASGGSSLHARELAATDAKIVASGGSDITVCATGAVRASASGGSRVDVHCDPSSLEQDTSGGSDIVLH